MATEATVGSPAFEAAKSRLLGLNTVTADRFSGDLTESDMGLEHPRPAITLAFEPGKRQDLGRAPAAVKVLMANVAGYVPEPGVRVEVTLDSSADAQSGFRLRVSPQVPSSERFALVLNSGFPGVLISVEVIGEDGQMREFSDPSLMDARTFGENRAQQALRTHLQNPDTKAALLGWVADCLERRVRPESAPEDTQ